MFDSTNILPFGAMLAIVVVSLALWSRAGDVEPLDAVADVLRMQARPGDLLILDDSSLYFDVARFEPLFTVAADRTPQDIEAFSRIFVVSTPDLTSSVQTSMTRLGTRLWEREIAGYRVVLYQTRSAEEVVSDLGVILPTARVDLVADDGTETPCPWTGSRFQCPGADWVYVGRTVEMIGGHPQRCIWSHPSDDATVRVTFASTEGASHVVGWYALTDYAVAILDGSRATLRLGAGAQERSFHAHRNRGRRRLEWALPGEYNGPLALEFTAERPGVRHLCWDLRLVSRTSGPVT